jgi:hypothetical protein
MFRSIVRLSVVSACAFVLSCPDAFAQGLTGAIEGTLQDNSGGVLPGVTVTLSSPGMVGGAQVQVTEGDGKFRFRLLTPGTYALSFELAGFQRVERTGLVVAADRTLTIDQVLGAAAVQETLIVTGEAPLVDVRSTTVANTVDSSVIQDIPVARRFTDLLNVMPGVQNGLYTFSPINAVYGSKVTDNVYQVDGINFVDPQVSAPITDVAYDDIAEVQVSTSGQSAEFGSASGGVFNFITKSGTNRFNGLTSGYVQTKGMSANNITDDLAALGIRPTVFDHQYDYGGNLGGPIVRDKVFFFGSYYGFDQSQSISDFPIPIPTTQWQTTAKVDAQISAANRVNGYFNYRNRTWEPFNFGFTTAADPRTWIGIKWKNPLSTIGWTSTLGQRTVLQTRFGLALFDLVNYEPNAVPGTPVYVEQNTGVIGGGPDGSFGVQNRDRYALKSDLSHYVPRLLGGSHDLKFGFEYEWLRLDNERRDQAGANGILHQTLGGAPFRVVLRNFEAQRRSSIDHWSAYAQNQWAVGSRTTINAGLRLDHWTGAVGPDDFFGTPFYGPVQIAEQSGVIDLTNLAPRLGIAFDVLDNRKMAAKVSWGRFYQRVDGVTIGVAEQGPFGAVTYDWLDCRVGGAPATCQTAGAVPGDGIYRGDAAELGVVRADSRPNPNASGRVDDDIKMPYTDSLNAGVEFDLGNGIGVSATYIYKRERDIWNRVNLTRFDLGAADPYARAYNRFGVINPLDGRPIDIYSVKPELAALPQQLLLTNPENPLKLFRNYSGLELVARRRLDAWMMQVSYNLGKSNGSVGTLFFDHQGSPYLDPNNLINIEGDQQLDRRHIFKVNGLYRLPYGVQVSSQFQVLSGIPWYTTGSGGSGNTGATRVRFDRGTHYPTALSNDAFIRVPGEPQGANRFDSEIYWDFRLEKRTRLTSTANLDLMVDVFNLLNRNTVVRVQTLNIDLPNYLRPAQILSPRAARLGVRLTF